MTMDTTERIACRVRFRGHELALTDVSIHDPLETLVTAARERLRRDAPDLELPSTATLWSVPRQQELDPESLVESAVADGDVLELRARNQLRGLVKPSPLLSPGSVVLRSQRHLELDECRRGLFVVTAVSVEDLEAPSRFRFSRISLALRLRPYDRIVTLPPCHGPPFAWTNVACRFKHDDESRRQLILHVEVSDDPPLGSKSPLGMTAFSLVSALDAPGLAVTQQAPLNFVAATEKPKLGRVVVSLCFHPIASKGPTVHTLLRDIAASNLTDHAPSGNTINTNKRGGWRSLFRGRRKTIHSIQAALHQQTARRSKGTLTFRIRGIHLCGQQCSKLDGHSTFSYPDFSPIVIVRFDDQEFESRVGAAECDIVAFEQVWPVYSSFACVEVEVYRKALLAAASTRKLSDGTPVVRICNLTISCHEILEYKAASLTCDPPPVVLGPGKNPPKRHFRWYAFMEGDDEVGLAHIHADFHEDFSAFWETEEHPDLTFVPRDERSFDPAIVLRNFERLDEIFTQIKEVKEVFDGILDWKQPIFTFTIWMSINLTVFYLPTTHLPFYIVLGIITLLCGTLASFVRGNTHKKWIEKLPAASRLKMFRPVATLRLVPVRAHNIRPVEGTEEYPDTFVRVFYEPNYKSIPVHLIAQTECARRTSAPLWAISQRDGLAGVGKDEFVVMNNRRLRDMIKHLSSHAQDAILHDVVEPWKRPDGSVDTHAFKYPILQPVQKIKGSNEEVLISWGQCPGMIRFDVLQAQPIGQDILIGRTRVPIRSLVSDEQCGGPQEEHERTLALVVPSRTPSSHTRSSADGKPSLTVRMQLILRNPSDRVSLRESLASEAMYEVIEMESEKEMTWVEKYHKAKDVAKNIQVTLGQICSTLERIKNLFLWVQPAKTLLVFVATVAASVCFYYIPVKYVIVYFAAKKFTQKFHRAIQNDFVRFQNFLVTIPTDLDMKRIYHWRNQEFLRVKEHTEAQAKLQAQWAGCIWKRGDGVFNSWQERYCAVRSGRLEIWQVLEQRWQTDLLTLTQRSVTQCIADAKSGTAPKHLIAISNVVDKCNKLESAQVPKDAFPLVVFDVSRHLMGMSSRGRRRVICAKSEEDFQHLVDAIHTVGEQIRPIPANNTS